MRLTIVTDAWGPSQINGVVRTLETTVDLLRRRGEIVTVIHPGLFHTFALPRYPEIRVARNAWKVGRLIRDSAPDYLHIAVEGSLGFTAKLWADRRGYKYTTAFHTRFPEYLLEHYRVRLKTGYGLLRWFHSRSAAVMVNTPSMRRQLTEENFDNLVAWGRGVDTDLFRPDGLFNSQMFALPRPLLLNVGRVSIEKNLPAFYEVDVVGTKVQVGAGPMLANYRERYPDVVFLGTKVGSELAACYRTADVFVFPSLTDTYGLVMLEAIASGVPVAAYPVPGPNDVVFGMDGVLNDDLGQAIRAALAACDTAALRASALRRGWDACTDQFAANLVSIVT